MNREAHNFANQRPDVGSFALQYDANGNVTNWVTGTHRLYWNARNQLTNHVSGVFSHYMAYDGLGRRVQRGYSSVRDNYLYDGLDIIQTRDNTGVVTARYFRGLAIDEPWQQAQISMLLESGPTNSLRGWWKFNEGTGSAAADSSGNGNTGTLTGGASWGSGVASNAVVLDGANGYVNVGDKATLEGNATWTFAAWLNPDSFSSARDTWLFYKQNVLQWGFLSGASRQQSVNIGGGGNNSLQGAVTNSTQLSSNTWSHIAVTYTNSTVKFYVNGMMIDTISKTYTMGSNNKAFSISTSSQSFDGKLDDLRYYNRALSESEIGQVYGETATNRVYMADTLGSVVALTDDSRTQRSQFNYEPFGTTTTTGEANESSPFRFTARESDPLTSLYYYRARYYHPALGRFISEDPIRRVGGDVNYYAYVGNDPTGSIDPGGASITWGGSKSWQKEVMSDISFLSTWDPCFKKQWEKLDQSTHEWKVMPSSTEGAKADPFDKENAKKVGVGSGGEIRYNRYFDVVTQLDGTFKPSEVLVHEVQHASDHDRGITNFSGTPSVAEMRAVQRQNAFHSILWPNTPLRRTYDGNAVPDFDKPCDCN